MITLVSALALGLTQPAVAPDPACAVSLMVLGAGQDGGKPQIGNPDDPAWSDTSLTRLATSLALIDDRGQSRQRYLFEATPDVKLQLQRLDTVFPARDDYLSGIFLTHAHIGHYAGLALFGHESMGAQGLPVYALPRFREFLSENGPWDQLVRYENIILKGMKAGDPVRLSDGLSVMAFEVPHRQEYAEVAGYSINGPEALVLFIPDIDSWEDWDAEGVAIEDAIAAHDVAYLDATFYADGEIPGRDMSGFPHPFITHSIERFAELPEAERAKVRFIHLNHTNPAILPDSDARKAVQDAGHRLAEEGEILCLD